MKALEFAALCGFAAALTSAAFAKEVPQPVGKEQVGPVLEVVCHLEVHRHWSPVTSGTAVLYRNRYLLTAGHHVAEDWLGIKYIHLRCGEENVQEGTVDEVISSWQIRDARGYFDQLFDAGKNYGVIRLKRPIETSVQVVLPQEPDWLSVNAPQARTQEPICLFGYQPAGNTEQETLHQACTTTIAKGPFKRGVKFGVETKHSSKGGPLLRKVDDSTYELVAINTRRSGSGVLADHVFKREVNWLIDRLDRRAGKVSD